MLIVWLLAGVIAPVSVAQRISTYPVYIPDSPIGNEALRRAVELGSVGSLDEAVRVLQRVLDEHGGAVTASQDDPDLFISLRRAVHDVLLERPNLLARYRTAQGAVAAARLAGGAVHEVERTRMLTEAGFEATLQRAQAFLEDARFESAWIMIEQLDRHPDRSGVHARQAARLLELISAYIAPHERDVGFELRDVIDRMLKRWQREAGLDSTGVRAPEERPDETRGVWVFDPAPPASLQGILPRPLASTILGPQQNLPDGASTKPATGRENWLNAAPCIAGDLAIVNDSLLITAWNRFTLKRVWQIEVHAPLIMQPVSRRDGLDDLNTVIVENGIAIAISGLSMRSRSATERAILAIDVETGTLLWSTSIPQLNVPELLGATIRGQGVIDQGVVVLTAIKHLPQQRLIGAYTFGLDLRTGALRWNTQMGSIGALPFGWNVGSMDASAAADGITYRCEQVGVITAIESATGRVRWIRRMEAPSGRSVRPSRLVAWQNNKPQIVGDRMYTFSPSRDTLLSINRATGRIEARALASWFDDPDYVLVVRDTLIGVSTGRLMAQPLNRFGTTEDITQLGNLDMLGRVSVAGDMLIAPTPSGISTVRVSDGVIEHIRLNESGQAVVVNGQVIVADDDRVHAYARWEVAEQHLRQRMVDDPLDPEPSITLAQLSFQAEHPESIMPAVDHALRAIDAALLNPESDVSRRKLFRALLGMVNPGEKTSMVHLDRARRAELLHRLGRCAASQAERIEQLMATGAFLEAGGHPRDAIAQYQLVLELALSEDRTHPDRRTMAMATKRVREIVRREGRASYASFDAEAAAQRQIMPPNAHAPALESLALRYPAATDAVSMWSDAADTWFAAHDVGRAIMAIDEAIDAATALEPIDASPRLILEGRAVTALMHADRPEATLRRLRQLNNRVPSAVLSIDGVDMPVEAALDAVETVLDQRPRRAHIGEVLGVSRTLNSWTLFDSPFKRTPDAPTNRILMKSGNGSAGLFVIDDDGILRPTWIGRKAEEPLRESRQRVHLARQVDSPPTANQAVICRDATTGGVLWETEGFEAFFDAKEKDTRTPPHVQTPRLMNVSLTELTHLVNDDVVISIDRGGRAVGLDARTGALLWTANHIVDALHDADLGNDVLLVGGGTLRQGQHFDREHSAVDRLPIVVAIDCRTGDVLSTFEAPSAVRWVVATPEDDMILGLTDRIMSLDPYRGMPYWAAVAEELKNSRSAVAVPGQLIVRTMDNELWQVESSQGSLAAGHLTLGERIAPGFDFIEVASLGKHIGIATAHGVAVVDAKGDTIGIDSLAGVNRLAPATFGRDRFVHATVGVFAPDNEHLTSQLSIFELPDGRAVSQVSLSLWTEPKRVALVDGHIIISGSFNSVVIEAPGTEAVDEREP